MAPKAAWLTSNRKCNMRCPWCYAQGTDFAPAFDMSFDLAASMIETAASAGIKQITLIGGEPTLWPHLVKMNKLIRSKGMSSVLATNGVRFGSDSFWNSYLECPNDSIGISIKAWDRESTKKIVGIGDFDLLVKGLKRGISAAKAYASFVVTDTCVDHLEAMADFAFSCGARYISVSMGEAYIVKGNASTEGLPTMEALTKNVPAAYSYIDKLFSGAVSFTLKTPMCIWPREFINQIHEKKQIRTGCHVQKRSGIIFNHDGGLALCNSLMDFPIGQFGVDVTDGDSLLELATSKKVTDIYDRITSYPSEKCSRCSMWSVCGGGCPINWTAMRPDDVIVGWQ